MLVGFGHHEPKGRSSVRFVIDGQVAPIVSISARDTARPRPVP